MRANEFITELFQPGKKNWEWAFRGSEEAVAEFKVGDIPYRFLAYSENPGGQGAWEVEFKNANTKGSRFTKFGLTGTGNSAEVMSIVTDIMREFLQQYQGKVTSLVFSADEESRQSLYARMAKRLLPDWKLSQHDKQFILTAPEKELDEEVVDEYYIHEPVDVKDILATGDKYNSERGRLRPVKVPFLPFDVKYIKRSHGRDSYYMFDDAQRCIGLFSFDTKEVPFLEYYLKPGVKVVTPHMTLASKYQRTGLATKAYQAFLESGPFVFVTKSHTEGANKLWDKLSDGNIVSKYFYQDLDFAPRIVNSTAEIEPQAIANRAIRVLGPVNRFK